MHAKSSPSSRGWIALSRKAVTSAVRSKRIIVFLRSVKVKAGLQQHSSTAPNELVMVTAVDEGQDSVKRRYLGLGAHMPAHYVVEFHIHPELELPVPIDD